jgi:hypothetical protein
MIEFKRQQKELRLHNRRKSMTEQLDTLFGRDQADAKYMSSLRAYYQDISDRKSQQRQQPSWSSNMNDIDDQEFPPPPSSSPPVAPPLEKPKHPLMECCNDAVVVAMRLDKTDIAMELLREELEATAQRWVYYKMQSSPTCSASRGGLTSVQFDERYYNLLMKVFIRPLDEENNTLLHYAVYLEDYDMISYVVLLLRRLELFSSVVLYENARRRTANDYALGCSRGSAIPKMMAILTEEAKAAMTKERTTPHSISPRSYSFQPLVWTITCLLVGRYIMGCTWAISLIVVGVSRTMTESSRFDGYDNGINPVVIFFSYHLTWILLRSLLIHGLNCVNYLGIPWQIQVLVAVFVPLNMKLKHYEFLLITIPSKTFYNSLMTFLDITPTKGKIRRAVVWDFIILTTIAAFVNCLRQTIVSHVESGL